MIGLMIREPMELPGGKKRSARRMKKPVLLEERADLVFGPPVQEREQHLGTVERRDRDQVEDHQQQVDLDEQVEDLQHQQRELDDQLRIGEQVAQRDRAGDRQHQVRDRPGGGHDAPRPAGRPRG